MRLAVIGTGYVGLVTGACLARAGHHVCCVDRLAERINHLSTGDVPFYEPGLADLVIGEIQTGRLRFTTDLAIALDGAEVAFIAVGTPPRADGEADVSQVLAAAAEIGTLATSRLVVVNKSTVPVGMGEQVENAIRAVNPDLDFAVVSNPEFLREGSAIGDFNKPDRIVIGSEQPWATQLMEALYARLGSSAPVVVTDRRTSELIKYAANSFLALKLSFINEIADLCEAAGADVRHVARGIGLDRRIGETHLRAGPGYGGSCFPKDTLALASIGRSHNAPLRLVETAMDINEERKLRMADKLADACGGSLAGKTVGVLGLTFKPETDDMREAPSLVILPELARRGARIRVHDPVGMRAALPMLPPVQPCRDAYECAEGADVLVLMTEWSHYLKLDFLEIWQLMRRPVLVDFRNAWPVEPLQALGFACHGIGRPSRRPSGSGVGDAKVEKRKSPAGGTAR